MVKVKDKLKQVNSKPKVVPKPKDVYGAVFFRRFCLHAGGHRKGFIPLCSVNHADQYHVAIQCWNRSRQRNLSQRPTASSSP